MLNNCHPEFISGSQHLRINDEQGDPGIEDEQGDPGIEDEQGDPGIEDEQGDPELNSG